MNLKICGITRLEDARYIVAAGATHLGFIQDPSSPRYIEPLQAKEIIEWVYGAESVGVFVDPDPEEMNRAIDIAGFDMVQLHGNESPEFCRTIQIPTIKVISIGTYSSRENIYDQVSEYVDTVDWLMFDTARQDSKQSDSRQSDNQLPDGTRTAFDWTLLTGHAFAKPFFLAGGINGSNLQAAADLIEPDGLDVSSSLESSPGIKDFDKVDRFMTIFNNLPDAHRSE